MKQDIRKAMLGKRRALDPETVSMHSASVIRRIEALDCFKTASVIGVYKAFGGEIDLCGLRHPDAVFVYPRVEGNVIRFILPEDDNAFEKSAFGVMEPLGGIIMDEAIDLLLVPAVAISSSLDRIGYGKGFYDRFLRDHRPPCVIGVVHAFQIVEFFDVSEGDQKLDMVITEES
jgi:5-formyltetrahydrofolate cyclo-ligase